MIRDILAAGIKPESLRRLRGWRKPTPSFFGKRCFGRRERPLDTDEDKAIEMKREMVAGHERMTWNPTLSIPAKEFEFSDVEIGRIRLALQTWESYGATADRRWLQPLIEELFGREPNVTG